MNLLDGKKIAFIVGGIALALFSLYLAGFIVMIQKESLPYTMMQSPLMHFVAGITSIRGWLYALVFGGVVSGIAFIVLRKNGELDVIKGSDSRGVDYSSKGTYGTAEWMSAKKRKRSTKSATSTTLVELSSVSIPKEARGCLFA